MDVNINKIEIAINFNYVRMYVCIYVMRDIKCIYSQSIIAIQFGGT